jgi:hypothetical protein
VCWTQRLGKPILGARNIKEHFSWRNRGEMQNRREYMLEVCSVLYFMPVIYRPLGYNGVMGLITSAYCSHYP